MLASLVVGMLECKRGHVHSRLRAIVLASGVLRAGVFASRRTCVHACLRGDIL